METRNISLTLDKAKEWYNSGNVNLKEVALQAFTEKELEIIEWQDIKTFEDACRALEIRGLFKLMTDFGIDNIDYHLKSIWKIDVIRKALNGNWRANLEKGIIHYPWVKITSFQNAPDSIKEKGSPSFIYRGFKYILVGSDYTFESYGLSSLHGSVWNCNTNTGLLGCKSKEIAIHMSKYFTKEIFLACYAAQIGDEIEWL